MFVGTEEYAFDILLAPATVLHESVDLAVRISKLLEQLVQVYDNVHGFWNTAHC